MSGLGDRLLRGFHGVLQQRRTQQAEPHEQQRNDDDDDDDEPLRRLHGEHHHHHHHHHRHHDQQQQQQHDDRHAARRLAVDPAARSEAGRHRNSSGGDDADAAGEDDCVLAPSGFDIGHHTQFVDISDDRLQVSYTGGGLHEYDIGTIVGDRALCPAQDVAYFEVNIVSCGARCTVAVGVGRFSCRTDVPPGFEAISYGYHSADGRVYNNKQASRVAALSYRGGDVVGCGVNFAEQEMFFTLNGHLLESTVTALPEALSRAAIVPIVSLHAPGETIRANFGTEPFVFALDVYLSDVQRRELSSVRQVALPNNVDLLALVREYVAFCGFGGTLEALQRISGTQGGPGAAPVAVDSAVAGSSVARLQATIDVRQRLRELVRNAKLDELRDVLSSTWPGILDRNVRLAFALDLQDFVERVRAERTSDALLFARSKLHKWRAASELLSEDRELLESAMLLLAYRGVAGSPGAELLLPARLTALADVVNAAVMAETCGQSRSTLETLAAQLVLVQRQRRIARGGTGAPFRIERWIERL